jgi:hypothetical protein
MSIGKKAAGAPPSPAQNHPESSAGEWCVRVSISVLENVPAPILRNWMIVEGFARDQPECWPSNKALAARFGVKVRYAKYIIESLEDHGVIVRRLMPGNRRTIVMARRTATGLSATEWAGMVKLAERRAAGRVALAAHQKAERKAHRPKIRIVG